MKELFTLLFILFSPLHSSAAASYPIEKISLTAKKLGKRSNIHQLYMDLKLKDKVSYIAFKQAIDGYNKITTKNKNIITLIDFSKPSTEERLYVIDIKNKKVLQASVVSHAKNSGDNYATSFSNSHGSHKSSLGFFVTEKTYQGRNGYSLVLDGLEEGINDQAKERAIVIHGASYANPAVAASSGRLGRSFGCPALPTAVNREIIDTIKDGSLLYIYADDANYLKHSTLLARNTDSVRQRV